MSTATVNPTTTSSTGVLRPDRSPAAGPVIDFGPRQSFLTLVRLKLRKTVDTRSGKLLLGAIVALSMLVMGWGLTHLPAGPVSFTWVLNGALTPVDLILPVVGILAMTSEWTQRTALTTFTLSPRRIPVLFAKLTAALVLAFCVVAVVVALSFGATALGGVLSGDGATYAHALRNISGSGLVDGLNVVMAAGIGLVAMVTAVGVLVYYIAPTLWALAAPGLFHHNSKWLDVFNSFDQVSSWQLGGHVAPIITSMAVWIVLPVTVGLILANRREVK